MTKVFTLTLNPSLDRFLTIDKMIPKKTIRAKLAGENLGGKGLNVSRVLSKLRVESKMITILGGHNGVELKQIIQAEKLDCDIIQSDVESRICSKIDRKSVV